MSVTTTLYTKAGAEAGTVDLPEALFAAPVNTAVLHQAVVAQLAGRRTGTADTKTRGEVRGGGKKPYRQKGTGRARQGTRTAPHYAGGGVVFGPHPRSYVQKLPKRMRRLALQGALTSKFTDGAIKVVADLDLDAIKTRELVGYLDRAPGPGPGARRGGRQGRAAGTVGTQPAGRRRHPRRLAQRGRHPQRGHAGHHPAVHRHDGGGVRVTLQASQVVLRPVISEKSMDETQRHKYTFAVHDDANKLQIKQAVQELFKVTVIDVNVSTTKPKEKSRNRKRGRIKGYTSPWKKAVVTVKSTDKIEFFEGV